MNALLRLKLLRKPATPQQYLATRDVTVTCSVLHDARGMTLAELIAGLGVRWRSFDPEDDVLDYVHRVVNG